MNRATAAGRLIFRARSALAIDRAVVGLVLVSLAHPSRRSLGRLPALLLGHDALLALVIPAAAYAPARRRHPAPGAAGEHRHGDAGASNCTPWTPVAAPSRRSRQITPHLAPGQARPDYEFYPASTKRRRSRQRHSHPGWEQPCDAREPGAVARPLLWSRSSGASDPVRRCWRVYTGFINPDSPPPDHFPVTARDPSSAEITPMPAVVEIAPHAPATQNRPSRPRHPSATLPDHACAPAEIS